LAWHTPSAVINPKLFLSWRWTNINHQPWTTAVSQAKYNLSCTHIFSQHELSDFPYSTFGDFLVFIQFPALGLKVNLRAYAQRRQGRGRVCQVQFRGHPPSSCRPPSPQRGWWWYHPPRRLIHPHYPPRNRKGLDIASCIVDNYLSEKSKLNKYFNDFKHTKSFKFLSKSLHDKNNPKSNQIIYKNMWY